jgi:hypothetical protein
MNNIPLFKSREDLGSNRFYAFINGAKPTNEFIPVKRIVHVSRVEKKDQPYHREVRPAFGRVTRWVYTAPQVWEDVMETGKHMITTNDPEAVSDYHSLIALGLGDRIIVVDGQQKPAT